MPEKDGKRIAWSLGLVTAMSTASLSLLGNSMTFPSAKPMAIIGATLVVCIASLLSPKLLDLRWQPSWYLGLAFGTLIVLAQTGLSPVLMLRLALATTLLLAVLTEMVTIFEAHGSRPDLSRVWLFLALVVVGSAPVWLAPWIDACPLPFFVEGTIMASPLSYLAVMVDYDYLRSRWFYIHTPFGGLRYTYPGAGAYTSTYLGLYIVVAMLRRWWSSSSPRP